MKPILLEIEKSKYYLYGNKLYNNSTTMHIPDGKQLPQHIYLLDETAEIEELP